MVNKKEQIKKLKINSETSISDFIIDLRLKPEPEIIKTEPFLNLQKVKSVFTKFLAVFSVSLKLLNKVGSIFSNGCFLVGSLFLKIMFYPVLLFKKLTLFFEKIISTNDESAQRAHLWIP